LMFKKLKSRLVMGETIAVSKDTIFISPAANKIAWIITYPLRSGNLNAPCRYLLYFSCVLRFDSRNSNCRCIEMSPPGLPFSERKVPADRNFWPCLWDCLFLQVY